MKLGIKILVIGLLAFVFINNASAATREEMLTVFPESILDSLTEEQYNHYATLDFDSTVTQEIIVPYSEYPQDIAPYGSETQTTSYKRLKIAATPYDSTNYFVTLTNDWLQIPSTRSYDVIAVRFEDMYHSNGTQTGYQMASTRNIGYNYNGTNIINQSSGFGISMNLVNESITYLQNFISVDAVIAGSNPRIYGAYQHAITDVSLAQSQSYNISYAGLGYVINFTSNVVDYYDAMSGVYIDL